jgi:hypothetical protein
MIGGMGYHVVKATDQAYEERTPPVGREGDPARRAADLTTAAALGQSRARLWR